MTGVYCSSLLLNERQIVTIGTKVRALRRELDISSEQLAVRSGTSSSTLGRLERANIVPKLPILERIAAELGTNASSLLSEAS